MVVNTTGEALSRPSPTKLRPSRTMVKPRKTLLHKGFEFGLGFWLAGAALAVIAGLVALALWLVVR